MYHKEGYSDGISLKSVVEKENEKMGKRRQNEVQRMIDEGLDWYDEHKEPVEDEPVEEEPVAEEFDSVRPATKLEEKEVKSMARPSKKQTLVKKLREEAADLKDDVLKIDTKILDPLDISDMQVKLLKAQRQAMLTTANIVELRADDLEEN